MFRCQVTGAVSAPKEPMHRVVVERRLVTYTNWRAVEDPTHRNPRYVEHITQGWEIVRELRVSAEGANQLREKGLAIE